MFAALYFAGSMAATLFRQKRRENREDREGVEMTDTGHGENRTPSAEDNAEINHNPAAGNAGNAGNNDNLAADNAAINHNPAAAANYVENVIDVVWDVVRFVDRDENPLEAAVNPAWDIVHRARDIARGNARVITFLGLARDTEDFQIIQVGVARLAEPENLRLLRETMRAIPRMNWVAAATGPAAALQLARDAEDNRRDEFVRLAVDLVRDEQRAQNINEIDVPPGDVPENQLIVAENFIYLLEDVNAPAQQLDETLNAQPQNNPTDEVRANPRPRTQHNIRRNHASGANNIMKRKTGKPTIGVEALAGVANQTKAKPNDKKNKALNLIKENLAEATRLIQVLRTIHSNLSIVTSTSIEQKLANFKRNADALNPLLTDVLHQISQALQNKFLTEVEHAAYELTTLKLDLSLENLSQAVEAFKASESDLKIDAKKAPAELPHVTHSETLKNTEEDRPFSVDEQLSIITKHVNRLSPHALRSVILGEAAPVQFWKNTSSSVLTPAVTPTDLQIQAAFADVLEAASAASENNDALNMLTAVTSMQSGDELVFAETVNGSYIFTRITRETLFGASNHDALSFVLDAIAKGLPFRVATTAQIDEMQGLLPSGQTNTAGQLRIEQPKLERAFLALPMYGKAVAMPKGLSTNKMLDMMQMMVSHIILQRSAAVSSVARKEMIDPERMRNSARVEQSYRRPIERPLTKATEVEEDEPLLESHNQSSAPQIEMPSVPNPVTEKVSAAAPTTTVQPQRSKMKKHQSTWNKPKASKRKDDAFAAEQAARERVTAMSSKKTKADDRVRINAGLSRAIDALGAMAQKLSNDSHFEDNLPSFRMEYERVLQELELNQANMEQKDYDKSLLNVLLFKKAVDAKQQERKYAHVTNHLNILEEAVTDSIEQAKKSNINYGRALLHEARAQINVFNATLTLSTSEWRRQGGDLRVEALLNTIGVAEGVLKQKEDILRKVTERTVIDAEKKVDALSDSQVLSNAATQLTGDDNPSVKRSLEYFFQHALRLANSGGATSDALRLGAGAGEQRLTEGGARSLATTNMSQALAPLFASLRTELMIHGADVQTIQRLEGVLTVLMSSMQRVVTGEAEFLMVPYSNEDGEVVMNYINIRDLLSGHAQARQMFTELLVNMHLHGHQGHLVVRVASSAQVAAVTVLMEDMPRLGMEDVNLLMDGVLAVQGPLTRQALQDAVSGATTSNALVFSSNTQKRIDERTRSLRTTNANQPLPPTAAVDLMRLLLTLMVATQTLAPRAHAVITAEPDALSGLTAQLMSSQGPALNLTDGPVNMNMNKPRRRNAIYGGSYVDAFSPQIPEKIERGPTPKKHVRFAEGTVGGAGRPLSAVESKAVEKQEKIDSYMADFSALIIQIGALGWTEGLKVNHRNEIFDLSNDLRKHLKTFLDKPSNAEFKVFKLNCENRIKLAEKQFAKEPFIWSLLKPICNLMINLMNSVKALIWPKTHTTTSMFKNVAEETWSTSKLSAQFKTMLDKKLQDQDFKNALDEGSKLKPK